MSVCQPRLEGNVIFSAPNLDRGLISSSFATYRCCHPCFLLCNATIYIYFYSKLKIPGIYLRIDTD